MQIDWSLIDTVLLDMDGTLLDRHFDDHFWLEHVPLRYAEKNGIDKPCAREMLLQMFHSQENTLNWTNLDYWSDRLALDIPALKEELDYLIAIHPFATEFLLFLRQQKSLELKLARTSLSDYFDSVISSHELGLPKEDPAFWGQLQQRLPFDPGRTMLGEDSETNLMTARRFGIRYLIHVGRYSSQSPPALSKEFCTIHYFSELLPQDGQTCVELNY
jgi:putative hydrolase of the HAD superfamily